MRTARALILALPFILAACAADAPRARRDETLGSRIEALALPHAEAGLLSGVLLVARRGQVEVEHAYGFAGWELRSPNSPETRFGIASITKPMTEVLVGVLADAGRLDLDAPVETYLPGFPRGPNGGAPTIRHLLDHRAGVPHRVTDPIDETRSLHAADIVERVKSTGLLFEPGQRRLYSSAGYTCLARIVEVIERKPFEQLLAERIFAPAGMVSATSETGQTLMPRRAMPYRLGLFEGTVVVAHAPYKDLRFLTGAGSVFATAEDLVHFVGALRDGVFGRDRWDSMFDASAEGWQGWTGRTNGYEASVDVLPARDVVFVFLSNLQSATNWQLRERVQGLLLGREPSPIPLPPPVATPVEDPASLLGVYGPASITLVDGSLFRGDNEFYPIVGGRYYVPASGSTMWFRRTVAGMVDALVTVDTGGAESVLSRSGGM